MRWIGILAVALIVLGGNGCSLLPTDPSNDNSGSAERLVAQPAKRLTNPQQFSNRTVVFHFDNASCQVNQAPVWKSCLAMDVPTPFSKWRPWTETEAIRFGKTLFSQSLITKTSNAWSQPNGVIHQVTSGNNSGAPLSIWFKWPMEKVGFYLLPQGRLLRAQMIAYDRKGAKVGLAQAMVPKDKPVFLGLSFLRGIQKIDLDYGLNLPELLDDLFAEPRCYTVEADPPSPTIQRTVGRSYRITAHLKNTGDNEASDIGIEFKIYRCPAEGCPLFPLAADPIESIPVTLARLGVGRTGNVSIRWTAPEAGRYLVMHTVPGRSCLVELSFIGEEVDVR
jgi:hypothetical protein